LPIMSRMKLWSIFTLSNGFAVRPDLPGRHPGLRRDATKQSSEPRRPHWIASLRSQ
jgi:hypothetical protein